MKMAFIMTIALSLFFASGCTSQSVQTKTDVMATASEVDFMYVDTVTGADMHNIKAIQTMPLKDLINEWLSDLLALKMDYGSTKEGENILVSLKVNDVKLVGDHLLIDFNHSFLEFNNAHTHPEYLIAGLREILKQTTDATTFSITIDGDDRLDGIHPDGLVIQDLGLD